MMEWEGEEHDGDACTIGRRVDGIRNQVMFWAASRGRGIEIGRTKGAGGGRVESHGAGREQPLGGTSRGGGSVLRFRASALGPVSKNAV